MIEPPRLKKPSSSFLSKIRAGQSPRKASKESIASDDPSFQSLERTSTKQVLKDQYNAYHEIKKYENHVKEVEQQNGELQQKREKAEAYLMKRGYSKQAAKDHSAAIVLQVCTAPCRLHHWWHALYSVRIGAILCTPLHLCHPRQPGTLGVRDPLQWM